MPSLGKVSLNTKDLDNSYKRMITQRARSVSKFVNCDHDLFDILCQFILRNKTKADFDSNFETWINQTRLINSTFKIEDLEKFIEALKSVYENSRNDEEVSDFRGKLLEVIVEKIYLRKYQDRRSIFEKGCEIEINKKKIWYEDKEYPENTKKTVDVAGYNMDDCEFYEVKVGPSNFKYNVIKYLNILKCKAECEEISDKILVGCITMDTRDNLKQNLMKVEKTMGVKYSGLEILGREDIKKMI